MQSKTCKNIKLKQLRLRTHTYTHGSLLSSLTDKKKKQINRLATYVYRIYT